MDVPLLIILTFYVLGYVNMGKSIVSDRKIKFSLLSKKNVTGHHVTYFLMKQTSKNLPEIWKVDMEHEITELSGLKSSNLLAVMTVPPPLPLDYKLFPGVGYYKFHNETANDFDDAIDLCSKEGGHLAIINSEEESNVLKILFGKHPVNDAFKFGYAYIGCDDRLKEGEFITIFGQPLRSTGFYRWDRPEEPNGGHGENCCSVSRNGALNDISCNWKLPFICEYELSWIDG